MARCVRSEIEGFASRRGNYARSTDGRRYANRRPRRCFHHRYANHCCCRHRYSKNSAAENTKEQGYCGSPALAAAAEYILAPALAAAAECN
jgi:hypothetical protein